MLRAANLIFEIIIFNGFLFLFLLKFFHIFCKYIIYYLLYIFIILIIFNFVKNKNNNN
jgi:hypothetical protein